jgi:hypothetical protein
MLSVAIAAAVAAVAAPSVQASPATVIIKGEAGQSVTLTAADLDALPQAAVTLSHDGHSFTLTGARLDAVLAKVDAPLGKGLHGPALADVILVKASDGYRVALSLGDVDPAVRSEPVILADREDGKPLGKDGPLRLAVGGDLKPARSARSVVEIDVLRLP